MAPHSREKKWFYVVFAGRVDKPTIYASWSQAHPRVIRRKGGNKDDNKKFRKFESLEAAREEIKARGFTNWDEKAEKTTSTSTSTSTSPSLRGKYYAVAGCETMRIFTDWEDAKAASSGTTACYRRCGTQQEAEEFIREWKDAYADAWRWEIERGLDNGWKPRDMKFDIGLVLDDMFPTFGQLGVEEESQE